MNAVEIGPVAPQDRTQSAFDIFWIWAGANIVATTLAVGASLASTFPLRDALLLILTGSLVGAALLGALAPLGPRLGVPSIIAARAALGIRGAGVVAFFMYVANFAWIAVNNVIAASSCAAIFGGRESERAWAFELGILATAIVAGGPGLVAKTDRVAVPLLVVLGVVLTIACLRLPAVADPRPGGGALGLARGLDVVLGLPGVLDPDVRRLPTGELLDLMLPLIAKPEFMAEQTGLLGTPASYNHYAVGWAHAMDTPYQWTKQVASHWGGTLNGTIVHWPKGIKAKGEIRSQFHHVIDVAPTVLEAAGLPQPVMVNGVQQKPYEGVSMAYSFDDAQAAERHETQYFEMFVNRGIYHKGWTAVTRHSTPFMLEPLPASDDDVWELYSPTGATARRR